MVGLTIRLAFLTLSKKYFYRPKYMNMYEKIQIYLALKSRNRPKIVKNGHKSLGKVH